MNSKTKAFLAVLWLIAITLIIGCAIYGNKQRSQPFLDTWANHAEQTASEPKPSWQRKDNQ